MLREVTRLDLHHEKDILRRQSCKGDDEKETMKSKKESTKRRPQEADSELSVSPATCGTLWRFGEA